jgi:hypothetical protein
MLGLPSHIEMHLFMDGFYRRMGWAHRTKRHDYKIINTMVDLYGFEGGLEAALHIACDLGLVTKNDMKVWQGVVLSEKPKISRRKGVKARGAKSKIRA